MRKEGVWNQAKLGPNLASSLSFTFLAYKTTDLELGDVLCDGSSDTVGAQ